MAIQVTPETVASGAVKIGGDKGNAYPTMIQTDTGRGSAHE
jgi:hypothetical protein